jgi:hypothetical protein
MATIQLEKDKGLQRLTDEINRVYSQIFKMPRYRYFQFQKDMYCWTTEPTNDGHFHAMIYRYVKTRKLWKMVKKVQFGRRKIAKARAFKWYQNAKRKFQETYT